MSSNLTPGQYQIGSVVFGRNTDYPVNNVEIQSYNTNAQDFQIIRADETRFGQDNLQPGPVIFTMGVLDNYLLPNMASMVGGVAPDLSAGKWKLHDLAREWRGDDVRGVWGQTKPLFCCERDGRVLMWFGRPRKFQYSRRSRNSQFFTVQAEYQRADTLQYSEEEYLEQITVSQTTNIVRLDGDAPAWYRILLYGPITNPIVQVGSREIELGYTIPSGRIVEISSYPWARRIIDDLNINLAAKLVGETQYLDQCKLAAGSTSLIDWSGSGTSGSSKMVFLWREAYTVMA